MGHEYRNTAHNIEKGARLSAWEKRLKPMIHCTCSYHLYKAAPNLQAEKQISQEAGQVVWHSHLFQNFPQCIVIHPVKDFGIVNKAEIDVFLELSCFLDDPAGVGLPCWSVVKNLPAMQETVFQSLGQEDPLEEGMVTCSSILAWEIPRTVEPGRL